MSSAAQLVTSQSLTNYIGDVTMATKRKKAVKKGKKKTTKRKATKKTATKRKAKKRK
jgi:hypothetical protein